MSRHGAQSSDTAAAGAGVLVIACAAYSGTSKCLLDVFVPWQGRSFHYVMHVLADYVSSCTCCYVWQFSPGLVPHLRGSGLAGGIRTGHGCQP